MARPGSNPEECGLLAQDSVEKMKQKNMCFPAMDNLRLGVFFGGEGKKELRNKREEGPPDHRMGRGLFLFYGPSLQRYLTVSMLWLYLLPMVVC